MNDEEKRKRIESLYPLAVSSKQLPRPKRTLFGGWKCPKCGSKLTKESVAEWFLAAEGGEGFANKVATEASLPLGAYNLSINHFTCTCGYEFAEANAEHLVEDG